MIRIFIILITLLTAAGCRTTHVSKAETSTQKRDSIRESVTTDSTNTSIRETFTKRKLSGASVGLSFTRARWDSLFTALPLLPAGAQTIYVKDPESKVQLAIMMDSLNQLSIKASALDQYYFEKITERDRYIQRLQQDLQKVISESDTTKKTDTLKEKQGFWFWITRQLAFLIIPVAALLFALYKIRKR